jgi:hypothetical protein
MARKHLLIGAIVIGLASAAQATTVSDPTGDYLASYTGPHQADLDVTSFSVMFNASTDSFLLQGTMAGLIDATLPGFYAIGINTGTGTGPFGSIGAPDVLFNQVIAVQKNGTATIGATALAPGSVTIGGNALSLVIPLSLLPSTGFDPARYGFNIWPRSGTTGGLAVISDFAPDNATVSAAAGAVPEPASWMMMLGGFGVIGGALRQRRSAAVRFV